MLDPRYGYRPIPSEIDTAELELLREALVQMGNDVHLLDKWYRKDSNKVGTSLARADWNIVVFNLLYLLSIVHHYLFIGKQMFREKILVKIFTFTVLILLVMGPMIIPDMHYHYRSCSRYLDSASVACLWPVWPSYQAIWYLCGDG